jgi:RNA polymerase sigma factor for flagellar operon FliA
LNAAPEPLPWSTEVRERESPYRTRFLESHVELVKYLALRISMRLPPSVEVQDLIHDGILGLIDAADRYDPDRGVRFRTYAESRIRGAILDGLREKDWKPRSLREQKRNLDAVLGRLSSLHHRVATEEEIAEGMGLSLDDYRAFMMELNGGPLLSLEELPGGAEPAVPYDARQPHLPLERKELIQSLTDEIGRLPERERRVLELYYVEALNMKEVGAVIGVTESRVCQLHAQAASRLRVGLAAKLHAPPLATPSRK